MDNYLVYALEEYNLQTELNSKALYKISKSWVFDADTLTGYLVVRNNTESENTASDTSNDTEAMDITSVIGFIEAYKLGTDTTQPTEIANGIQISAGILRKSREILERFTAEQTDLIDASFLFDPSDLD